MNGMNDGNFGVIWLLIIAVVIIASILIVRKDIAASKSSIEVAKEQLAKGEISEKEYKELLKQINSPTCNTCQSSYSGQ